jgi:hypothetical protein
VPLSNVAKPVAISAIVLGAVLALAGCSDSSSNDGVSTDKQVKASVVKGEHFDGLTIQNYNEPGTAGGRYDASVSNPNSGNANCLTLSLLSVQAGTIKDTTQYGTAWDESFEAPKADAFYYFVTRQFPSVAKAQSEIAAFTSAAPKCKTFLPWVVSTLIQWQT